MEMAKNFVTVGGKSVEIRRLQNVPKEKRNCFFYGGGLFEFTFKNPETGITGVITLSANGDVKGDLMERSTGRVLDSFKDKSNAGYRRHVESYIHNDRELEEAEPEIGEGQYALKLYDSNWLEWFFDRKVNKDGELETECLESVVNDSDIIPPSFEDCGLDSWFDQLTAL